MSTTDETLSVSGLTTTIISGLKRIGLRIVIGVMLFCHASYSLAQPAIPEAALKPFETGMAHVERQQYQAAIMAFSEAIAAHPPFVEAYRQRSQAHSRLGNLESAISDCSLAIEVAPTSAYAYNCRGNAYARAQRHSDAIQDYQQAIRLAPNYPWPYNNLGLAHLTLKQYDKAIAALEQAIERHPLLATAFNTLGVVHQSKGNLIEAIYNYNRALSLLPGYSKALSNRDNAYKQLSKAERDYLDFNATLEDQPELASPFFHLGNEHLDAERYSLALAEYARALIATPGHGRIYLQKGITYSAMGEYEQAIKALTTFLKRVPEEPEGHLRLAVAIEAVSHQELAQKAYEYFIHYTDKDDSRLDWAEQKIAALRKQ